MLLHHIVTFGDTLLHWQGQALQVSLSLSGIRGLALLVEGAFPRRNTRRLEINIILYNENNYSRD